jgi:hypothetical protein
MGSLSTRPGRLTGRTRLALERLEGRQCPSTGFNFLSFSATALPGHFALLKGTVADHDPTTVHITFTGALTGTATPNALGNFTLKTTKATLGEVDAQAVDDQGLTDEDTSVLDVPPPVLTLGITYVCEKTVVLSGSVQDIDGAGLPVSFKGVVNDSTMTDGGGGFSLTTTPSTLGSVTATVVNEWGLVSSPVAVQVTSQKPEIVEFDADKSPDGLWYFSGTVVDESPGGLVVKFSNLPGLKGKTATVGSDGKFSLLPPVALHLTKPGQARADVTDWWGLAADPAFVDVSP